LRLLLASHSVVAAVPSWVRAFLIFSLAYAGLFSSAGRKGSFRGMTGRCKFLKCAGEQKIKSIICGHCGADKTLNTTSTTTVVEPITILRLLQ